MCSRPSIGLRPIFCITPAPFTPTLSLSKSTRKVLDEIGPYPWPRAIHGALLDRLAPAAPRLIAFDLIFAQPSPDDEAFASNIKSNGNVILAATGVEAAAFPNEPDNLPLFDVVILPDPLLRDAVQGVGHRMIVPDSDSIVRRIPTAIQANNIRYPALGLAAAASALGNRRYPVRFVPRVPSGSAHYAFRLTSRATPS